MAHTKIKVSYGDVVSAVGNSADADLVWKNLTEQVHDPFDGRRMVMWFGGVLALLASTIFLGTAGVTFGALGFGLSLSIVMAGLVSGGWALKSKGHHFAGGMLATLFSGLVPLLVFSITDQLGVTGDFADYGNFFDYISAQWVWMELIAIVVGIIVVWKFDFGFASLPPTVAAYFFVMDAGIGLFDLGFETLALLVGFVLGAAMVALGVWFQLRGKDGHATWLLLYGLLSVLFGVNQLSETGTTVAMIYIPVGLSFLVLGWSIKRGIPVTIGGLAISSALCFLTYDYFDNSILFSLAVFAFGVTIVLIATFARRRDAQQIDAPSSEAIVVAGSADGTVGS